MKIGVGITTFNSESYFEELYNSIPRNKIHELVVCNGGKDYTKKYDVDWIQHRNIQYPSVARNDCLLFLAERHVDYFFIIEDDMILKNENVFDAYIEASNITGLQYMHFASFAWETGSPGARTPRIQVNYSSSLAINFYKHMCNEFTFRTKKCFMDIGLYNNSFRYTFDVDFVMRLSKYKIGTPMNYFPDLSNSDDYVMNNPIAESRMNENGKRDNDEELKRNMLMLKQLHGYFPNEWPDYGKDNLINHLNFIKNNKDK